MATNFWLARNTLTQKGQGPWSRGEVKFDLSHLKPGDVCGFGTLGKVNGHIAVNCGNDGKMFLSMNVIVDAGNSETRVVAGPVHATKIFLRTDLDFETKKGNCSYSLDDKNWKPLGGAFNLAFDWRTGTFQGEQFAIFCYNPQPGDGFVDVDAFRFTDRKE